MSEPRKLVTAFPVAGGDENLGSSWVNTHDLPGRVPPPTRHSHLPTFGRQVTRDLQVSGSYLTRTPRLDKQFPLASAVSCAERLGHRAPSLADAGDQRRGRSESALVTPARGRPTRFPLQLWRLPPRPSSRR